MVYIYTIYAPIFTNNSTPLKNFLLRFDSLATISKSTKRRKFELFYTQKLKKCHREEWQNARKDLT